MTVNEPLLREAVAAIEVSPERWDQANVENPAGDCGTTYCLAGWVVKLHRDVEDGVSIYDGKYGGYSAMSEAQRLLGLDTVQANILFGSVHLRYSVDSVAEFKKLITEATGVEFKEESECG